VFLKRKMEQQSLHFARYYSSNGRKPSTSGRDLDEERQGMKNAGTASPTNRFSIPLATEIHLFKKGTTIIIITKK
jgi:hypothetical protein